MFKFFRNNIQTIGWVIVLTFGLTMFGGSLFFSPGASPEIADATQVETNTFVMLGNVGVSYNRYMQIVANIVQMVNPDNKKMSPLDIEGIKLQALQGAVSETVFYQGAIQANTELSKEELKKGLMNVVLENDLKDKSELKKMLKEKNYDYAVFEESLKQQLLVEKFKRNLTQDISFDESSVSLALTTLDIQIITIAETTMSEEKPEINLLQEANSVYEKIIDGLDFEQAYDEYSFNKSETKGVVNNIAIGSLPEVIEKELFYNDVNFVTKPIEMSGNYFIIKILKKSEQEKDETIENDALVAQLTNTFIQRRLTEFETQFLIQNPIDVQSKDLKPIMLKQQQNYVAAINAYQHLSSTMVNDPSPHFFIATLYLSMNQLDKALEELAKAEIKAELSPELDFAELHFMYGDLLAEKGEKDSALEQYNKLYYLIEEDIDSLKLLEERYSNLKLNKKSQEIIEHIALLEELKEQKLKQVDSDDTSIEELEEYLSTDKELN